MKYKSLRSKNFLSIVFYFLDRATYYFLIYISGFIWKLEIYLRGVKPFYPAKTMIIGRPIIIVGIGSKVAFGKDVILMSSSKYCLSSSIYSPCKIHALSGSSIIEIGNQVSMNGASIVCRSSKISIGNRTMIGPNVSILDSPFHPMWPLEQRNYYPGVELDFPVEIGEDVWVGANVIILPGSKVGSGSVIGAGSIVRGEIPPNVLAAGVPAKVIRKLDQS